MTRLPGALALLLAAVVLVGCGGQREAGDGTGEDGLATRAVSVYFLLDGKVWPVRREVEETPAVASAAIERLLEGPTEEEREELSLESAVPDGTELVSLGVQEGVARVAFSTPLPNEALAQVVYTLTQFPTVDSVELVESGVSVPGFERADFEDVTPAILVESPRFFEEV
ncbi:MAG: GerMN domain-containing protein, partial [Thermoleophilia bacterium]|nr:GerMN domain-containing protein [Thermoleophilia bacterium]